MTFREILLAFYFEGSIDKRNDVTVGEFINKSKWIVNICEILSVIFFVIGIAFIINNYFNTNVLEKYNHYLPIFFGLIFSGIYLYLDLCNIIYLEDNLQNNTHETENLQEYEELRTQFTLHNIKNAVINANNYMEVLRNGKMNLEEATDNLQICLDRIDETLEVFKDSDKAKSRTEFKVEELFTLFQMLYSSKVVRQNINFTVIYADEAAKNQVVHQSYYDVFQIFNNLVINARKALENIDNKQIKILANIASDDAMLFMVSDTGAGILPEHQNKIFNLQFSTTGGDGVGLFQIRKVLEEMGGSIHLITPIQDFSTTFEVIIPIQKA